MSPDRPSKRVRQACEPCRRKKSRCPGEQPTCSHCARLGQRCLYAEDRQTSERPTMEPISHMQTRSSHSVAPGSGMEDRLKLVESQLAEVLANQRQGVIVSHAPDPLARPSRIENISNASVHVDSALPPWTAITKAAKTYLLYCDCQPLPLFYRGIFLETLHTRDSELLLSMLALSSRFEVDANVQHNAHDYLETARIRVAEKVTEGNVEVSTLQTLCLLALVDFTDGKTRRAGFHCSLAMSLAHNAGLAYEHARDLPEQDREERRRCFWSLVMLKRLHGADFMILDLADEDNFPCYPATTAAFNNSQNSSTETNEHLATDKGIVAYAIQLSEVWFKVTRYARRRARPNAQPPWSSQSDYTTILAHQMDFETQMPFIHRFEPAQFSQQTTEQLDSNRDYWGPWLFVQFLYHTNLCLLNHPLLLSLRLRNFKCVIPEIFLQHTADLVSSHASWIINFIEMLEAKSFQVTDPFLGHCVAIVSTIYLQESFVDDAGTREAKQESFEKCLGFIRSFGPRWPHMSRIADKLQKLAETVSSTYVASEEHIRQNRKLLIDLGQFFEILEYSSSSELSGSARNLYGPSLQTASLVLRTGMTETSVLPAPTRVERQEFGTPSANDYRQTPTTTTIPDFQADSLLAYSNDELAVLAENFFHQRPELNGNINWWNTQF